MTFAQPFGDYEVLDRVGAGSMGTVFKARHKKLNRTVALKVLKPSLARDTRYVDRLRREARIVASLNHPNIVTGYDLGQESGYHFFVMEFVEGKSLRELLNEWGMFAEDRVLDVAIQITIALDHAFRKGVIHRDIKPANILIANDNVVKLTDMGLAKGPDNLTLTRDGATVGTPQYISPEQAKSPQDVDVRSDLYSLGATLFHMCTGQPPFRAETMANVLVKVLEERAPSAAGFNPDLSDGLNLIIRKLLSKDPARRYQTPSELLRDLERVRRSELPEVDVEALDSGEGVEPRRRWLWPAAVVVSVALGATAWWLGRDRPGPPPTGPDPATAYRQRLTAELGALGKIGERLKFLRTLELRDTAGYQLAILAQRRQQCEQMLVDELPGWFRAEEARLRQTFDKHVGWVDPEGDLRGYVAAGIEERFGVVVPSLPAVARQVYDAGWARLSRELPELHGARVGDFRRAVADQTERLHLNLREELRDPDLPGAEAQLQEDLRGFDELGPPADRLPANLRQELADARAAAQKVGKAQIVAREQVLLDNFKRALGFLEQIRRDEPARAEAALDQFRQQLETDYPSYRFRPASDPWPAADQAIAKLRAEIAAEAGRLARATVEGALQETYAIAVGGNLTGAADYLRLAAGAHEPARVAAHRELLAAAAAVRDRLLGRLLATAGQRRRLTDVRVRGRRPERLEVRRVDAGYEVLVNGAKASFALLDMRDVLRSVGGDAFLTGLDPRGRAGLALWYVFSGDKDVVALIPPEQREFFRDDILRREFRAEAPAEYVAGVALDEIERLIAADDKGGEADWSAAKGALDRLRQQHPQFAAKNATLVRSFEKKIGAGLRRAAIRKWLLERERPGGMRVVVAEDESVQTSLDTSEAAIPELDRRGWTLQPKQPIHFPSSGLGIEAARDQALSIPTLLDVDRPITATVELAFAGEADHPRLVFVQCHGVTLGIGLQRDGAVAVFPVDRELHSSRLSQIRRDAEQALAAASRPGGAVVVPGARHSFEIKLRQKRGGRKWAVAVTMDGVALPGAEVLRADLPTAALVILPLEPVTLHRVAFLGRVRF